MENNGKKPGNGQGNEADKPSNDIPEEESDHLPFWSGMGRCYSGSNSTDPDVKYPTRLLAYNLPERKKQGKPQKPDPKPNANKPPVNEMGTPVTINAANKMVKEYYDFFKNRLGRRFDIKAKALNDIEVLKFIEEVMPYCVLFGKDALLSMLSQGGCEGIRYYFCRNPEGKPSLVFVAAKANHDDFGGGSNGSIIDKSPPIPDPATSSSRKVARQKTPTVEVGGTDPPRKLKAADIFGITPSK
jgi:hypothetical protein